MKRIGQLACILIALGVTAAHAQFSANYQTNSIDGTGVNWAGTYYVGSNTSFDALRVINGGGLTNGNGYVGFVSTATNNLALVSGAGSVWSNTAEVAVGYDGSGNQLVVSNGGRVVSVDGNVGRSSVSFRNRVTITDSGSVWKLSGTFGAAGSGSFGEVIITNGGQVVSALYAMIGNYGVGKNKVLVSGTGSLWKSAGDLYLGKNSLCSGNRLTINNGGTVVNVNCYIGNQVNVNSNVVEISGSGSTWTNSGALSVGHYGAYNEMTISDGAKVSGGGSVGNSAGANSNRVVVSGSGSTWTNMVNFYVGSYSMANQLIITNGGFVASTYSYVGTSSNNNRVAVTGPNSRWNYFTLEIGATGSGNQLDINDGATVAGTLSVNSYFKVGRFPAATGNIVRIERGGLLEANTLYVTNLNNIITNTGGIFQFNSATPAIFVTNGAAGGQVVLNSGVISFREVVNAPLLGAQLANIRYVGDNSYRLNGATNASVAAYTFDSAANTGNPTNYQALQLTGLLPRWQSTAMTIGSGGAMLASNTQATVGGIFTNNGTVKVVNATLTFSQAATLNGTVVIDLDHLATTNGVVTNGVLTLGPSSTLQFTGTYTNQDDLLLFRHTGARTGVFASQVDRPMDYVVRYGPATDGRVVLVRVQRGTVIELR